MRKRGTLFSLIVLFSLFITPIADASQVSIKKQDALYANIKVFYNGQEVYTSLEPFIVDGRAYIPLRMMGELFDKNVDWNPANWTAYITDKVNHANDDYLLQRINDLENRNTSLQQQIESKDNTIESLTNRVDQLQEIIDRRNDRYNYDQRNDRHSGISTSELEDRLNSRFTNYWSNIPLHVDLLGDYWHRTFQISFNYRFYKTEWDDRSDSEIRSLMARVYDDIKRAYPNSQVNGFVYDTDMGRNLASYSRNSSGSVIFSRTNRY